MAEKKHRQNNLQRSIEQSKKEVTILFTDIESSSKFWDYRGDIKGRLMVDQHNRLAFPVLKKYKGKVIKTIGDSLMVSFRNADNAVKASVAIQQILQKEREKNPQFPNVRIGIHTGKAIVEKGDVFGDMVNVASRIEGRAKGGDILISTSTLRKIKEKTFKFTKKERFQPKGKRNEITIHRCHWKKAESLIDDVEEHHHHILNSVQKWEIFGTVIVSICTILLLYIKYIRYLLSDSEMIAIAALNPLQFIKSHLILSIPLGLLALFLIILFFRIKSIPLPLFKALNGGVGFFVGFMLVFLIQLTPLESTLNGNRNLWQSKHLFVEVVDNSADLMEKPDKKASVLRRLPKGTLLLLNRVEHQERYTWNRVLIGYDRYAYVLRIQPPEMGIEERRVSLTNSFKFKQWDLYGLALGVLGFFVGFFLFKLKPT